MSLVKRVLVVEDDRDTRAVIEETLVAGGYDVDTASDSGMALRKVETTRYDLAVVDLMLPDLDGVMLQARIRKIDRQLADRLIFTTGFTDRPAVVGYLRHQGLAFLGKPFHPDQLIEVVRRALDDNPARHGALEREPQLT